MNTHGILMANSLHFVPDKADFLRQVALQLPSFTLIIVEYECTRANPWVPYPIDLHDLDILLRKAGAQQVEKVGDHPSRYHGKMYGLRAEFSPG